MSFANTSFTNEEYFCCYIVGGGVGCSLMNICHSRKYKMSYWIALSVVTGLKGNELILKTVMVFKSQIHQYLSHLHRINRPLLVRLPVHFSPSLSSSSLKTFLQFHPLHSFRLHRQFHFLQQSNGRNKLLWFLFYSSVYFAQFQLYQSIF